MASFCAGLEHKQGRPNAEAVTANRLLEEVCQPVIPGLRNEALSAVPVPLDLATVR